MVLGQSTLGDGGKEERGIQGRPHLRGNRFLMMTLPQGRENPGSVSTVFLGVFYQQKQEKGENRRTCPCCGNAPALRKAGLSPSDLTCVWKAAKVFFTFGL